MNSQTLQFTCLTTLAAFTKVLEGGYYSNIVNLTVKGKFSEDALKDAVERFGASVYGQA
jgi:hypothetical protein